MVEQRRRQQHELRDRDPDCPEEDQPKRPFQQDKDYFKLRRFRFDFGREHNATNYWDKRP